MGEMSPDGRSQDFISNTSGCSQRSCNSPSPDLRPFATTFYPTLPAQGRRDLSHCTEATSDDV